MIDNNLIIEKYSPNYDKIVNFLYEKDDIISKMLIEYYQDYLFGKNNRNKRKLDSVLDLYTDKSDFYRYVENYFTLYENDLFDDSSKVMNKLIKIYDTFESEGLKKVNKARWI